MSHNNLPSPQQVGILTQKLYDADSDIRYMSLIDLSTLFTNTSAASFLATDYQQCAKVVDGFLNTLNDTNGEVQNLTIKCLGPFVLKCNPDILCPLVHKLGNLTTDNTVDSTISAMAVRAVVLALPRPAPSPTQSKQVVDAYDAISRVLIPRLVGYIVIPHGDKSRPPPPKGLLEEDLESGSDSGFIDVLTEIAKCFGPILQPAEVEALQSISVRMLESAKTGSVMKKKAVSALSAMSHYFSEALLSSVLSHIIEGLRAPHLTLANRRLYINVIGSMARAIPAKFGPHLKTLAPFLFSALSQAEVDQQMHSVEVEERDPEADEIREAALTSLEASLSCCSNEMQRFIDEAMSSTLRLLKYDPNIAHMGDEDTAGGGQEDEDDFEVDEDFEEEGFGDDDDDVSWKVRRCAAKTLHTIIAVRSRDLLDSPDVFDRVAKALVDRFQEREETVRLEILNTLCFLIRSIEPRDEIENYRTNDAVDRLGLHPSPSRKRRRGLSDSSASDTNKARRLTGSVSPESESPPGLGAAAYLANFAPEIIHGTVKLIKTSTPASKQASMTILKELIIAKRGGVDGSLEEILNLIIPYVDGSRTDARSVGNLIAPPGPSSGTTIQIEALRLTSELAKANSSTSLQIHMDNLVPAVSSAAQEKATRTGCEALLTMEQLVKALTPPRMAHANQKASKQLEALLNVVCDIITAKTADLAIRQQALAVLGVLLGRLQNPQGSKMISTKRNAEASDLLFESMNNETTRFASIKAIDSLGTTASDKVGFEKTWFCKVCLELGAQLRKSDRSLRGASISALRTLLGGCKGSKYLDKTATQQLTSLFLPVVLSDDLHLVAPCLDIYAAIIRDSPCDVVSIDLIKAVCSLILHPNASLVLDPVCTLVESMGQRGTGAKMMQALLKDVGVNGSPSVVGKVIGDLLVSSGDKAGISTGDFLDELKTAADEKRRCLALSVTGEIGLRSGAASSLSPDLFVSYLSSKAEDVPLSAAIALGRAAAGIGNAKAYVPLILSRIKKQPEEQYLVLHSVRELLQYVEEPRGIMPFAGSLWDASVLVARSESSRTIGAECLASLAMLEPRPFLQSLQVSNLIVCPLCVVI